MGGSITFYSDMNKIGRLGMSVTRRLLEKNVRLKEEKVQSVLLSDYINMPVDFLKMDIEGAELAVTEDLYRNSKFKFIKELTIEYHYNYTNPDNKLSKILDILEKENFKYSIYSFQKLPLYLFKEKPYNLIIYAYK